MVDFWFGTLSCRRCEFHIWDSTAEFGWNAEAGESGRCSAVCVCFVWTPTVSGIWRIGTVIWAALCVSHKQMKAQSLKVRLISLSQLHREYCEYGEGFYSLRGSKGRLLSSLSSTHWKKKMACVQLLCPLIFTHSSYVLAAEDRQARHSWRARNPLYLKLGLELKVNNPLFLLDWRLSHTFHLVTENFSICAAGLHQNPAIK